MSLAEGSGCCRVSKGKSNQTVNNPYANYCKRQHCSPMIPRKTCTSGVIMIGTECEVFDIHCTCFASQDAVMVRRKQFLGSSGNGTEDPFHQSQRPQPDQHTIGFVLNPGLTHFESGPIRTQVYLRMDKQTNQYATVPKA